MDGTVDFYKTWKDYEIRFGELKSVFWLGNKFLNLLTSSDTYNMYIHPEDFEGNSRYAEYTEFSIGDATTKYTLDVFTRCRIVTDLSFFFFGGFVLIGFSNGLIVFSGDNIWRDSLMYSDNSNTWNQNGMMFSTYDKDTDRSPSNCALAYKGALWYNNSLYSNLNGKYLGREHSSYADFIKRGTWKGFRYLLKSTKMMIKRK